MGRRWTGGGRSRWVWVGLLALAEAVDFITTHLGMRHGTWELNPFVRELVRGGRFWLVKLLVVVAMALVVVIASRLDRRVGVRRAWGPRFLVDVGLRASVVLVTVTGVMNAAMLAWHKLSEGEWGFAFALGLVAGG